MLALIFAFLSTTPANAAPSLCTSPQALAPHAHRCLDNRIFTNAAEACLGALVNQTKNAGLALTAGSGAEQNGQLLTAARDYAATSARLTTLRAAAAAVRVEIDAYLDQIYLPIDTFDGANGGDPRRFALAHPCYGDTKNAIEDILKDVDYVQENLADAQRAMDNLGATAGQGAASLRGSLAGPKAQNIKAVGGGQVPQGQSSAPKSDVTGVKQDLKKQQQGN